MGAITIMNKKGFTFVELLAAILILGLVSASLASGVLLSSNQYKKSIRQSEASELYNTISSLLNNELKFTNEITVDDQNRLVSFKSVSYQIDDASLCNIYILAGGNQTTGYGQIAFGDDENKNYLLGNAAYTNDLGAKLSINYDDTLKMFKVFLDIGYNDSSIVSNEFDVRCLNRINVHVQ